MMEQHLAYHKSVMPNEVIDALNIQPAGIYVDVTFGGGGHSREILKKLDKHGRLIAFDQDKDAASNIPSDPRLLFIPQNFRHLRSFLRVHKIPPVNGILADLGVSSFQFDTGARGFSTRYEGRLDMRMNQSSELTAAKVLNSLSQQELQLIFQNYGEVTNAKTLATSLVEARRTKQFETMADLNHVLRPLAKGNPQRYFAQVYQSLRIEVNDELNALKEMLDQSVKVLAPHGRLVIITFHSLEDRIVKNFFRFENNEGERETDAFGNSEQRQLKIITKKPILPSKEEMKINARSRSAKLRVAEKIEL